MTVEFTDEARNELVSIEDYIARDNPVAARRVVEDIVRCCMALENTPELGLEIALRRGVPLRRIVVRSYLIVIRYDLAGLSSTASGMAPAARACS